MLEINKVYNEDCLTTMANVPDNFIDLTVTSPPYDNLRKYNGFSFEFEKIAIEVFRVIKIGGVVVWVVGDQTKDGTESGTSFRQALFFKEIGFNLHDTMIYKKENYLPLNHNRYDPEFEYMFILSKGRPKTFNPLKIKCKTAGDGYNFKNRNSSSVNEIGNPLRARDEDKITKEEKYRGNIWSYATGKNKGSKDAISFLHPATFPEKLAEDHILSWSNKDDLIYDPFMGSGTVAKIAKILGRNFIGSEISADYCDIANKRLLEGI
ncbi:DNA-methyltransferase [Flavobacterium sp.]|uniref:DNA-methyltransferase n=1 Tax=Flavobacterium sp. TaxID=239 RepID=UPI0038FCC4EA